MKKFIPTVHTLGLRPMSTILLLLQEEQNLYILSSKEDGHNCIKLDIKKSK